MLLCWGSLISGLIYSYMSVFFKTYYVDYSGYVYTSVGPFSWEPQKYWAFSPLMKLLMIVSDFNDAQTVSVPSGLLFSVLICGIISAALIVLCVVLYNKRPSEAAGHAMTFNVTKPFFKVIVLVPVALASGLLFYSIAVNYAWMVFGLIAGLLISHALVEIMYAFDFKACITHFISTAVAAAITAFVVCFFIFDLSGYDSYLPKVSDVASAAIASDSLQSSVSVYEDDSYVDNSIYRLKNMKLKDIDDVNCIAESGIANCKQQKENPESSGQDDTSITSNVTICWRLDSGRNVYRSYLVDLTDSSTFNAYSSIYATKEYKDTVFPILTADRSRLTNLYYTSPYDEKKINIDSTAADKLLETYKVELYMQSAEDLTKEIPLGAVSSHVPYDDPYSPGSTSYNSEYEWFIYPSFTKTIALLKDAGIDVNDYRDASKIDNITISCYDYTSDKSIFKIYSSSEDIQSIINACVPSNYSYMNQALLNFDNSYYDVEVTYKYDSDTDYTGTTSSMVFINGDVPGFVSEDLPYTEPETAG